ncbi:MAG: ferrous iron transport protein A [Alteromonadaceae bacterium]|nr:ferrous iron transport protein A [Alteromonadaceae bacterium]
MTLADIKAGQSVVISSLSKDFNARAKLLDLGLLPGTQLKLKRALGWSKAVQINVRQTNLILRDSLAKQIKVELLSDQNESTLAIPSLTTAGLIK